MLEAIESITLAAWLTLAAIFLGPIAAVYTARVINRYEEQRERKLHIFKALFRTRAQTLYWEHVAALNSIDLEFGKDKSVKNAWKEYLDHLISPADKEQWGDKRQYLLVNLLHEMAIVVGYDFDKTHIKNFVYAPMGYAETEADNQKLRKWSLEVLEGKRSIPISVPQQESNPDKP
ncbi:MAG: DUF6680 family protein [Gammaproteobacteria bacterium]